MRRIKSLLLFQARGWHSTLITVPRVFIYSHGGKAQRASELPGFKAASRSDQHRAITNTWALIRVPFPLPSNNIALRYVNLLSPGRLMSHRGSNR